MSSTKTVGKAAGTAQPPAAAAGAEGTARVPHGGPGRRLRRLVQLAVTLAAPLLLATACGGGSPGPAAPPGQPLYQQALAYSRCMHSHGVPEFPDPKRGPGGSLTYPLSPPSAMLSSPGYDTAFRACLKLAMTGGRPAARYQAMASQALRQAECMRAHGIMDYPSPAAIGGGIHAPDFTTVGIDTHTPRFQAAGKACRMAGLWQLQWWWPAGSLG